MNYTYAPGKPSSPGNSAYAGQSVTPAPWCPSAGTGGPVAVRSSFSQHLNAVKDAISKITSSGILSLFFGHGIGSAGPAALKLGGTISENYYLQIVFETGVLGLVVFLAFIASVVKKLFFASKTLFFAFVALLINALFLHIFSDNPAMSVTIFVLIALVLNIEDAKKETQVSTSSGLNDV